MADGNLLNYQVMVENALRSVLRAALLEVLEKGLPGDHHFYITFRTQHPGVEIPDALRARYPDDMTIVLQHQFWDLEVEEHRFCATLSFSGQPSRLVVPYEAVATFADPSVRFMLQFEGGPVEAPSEETAEAAVIEAHPEVTPIAAAKPKTKKPAKKKPARAAADESTEDTTPGDAEKIVALDRFRKK